MFETQIIRFFVYLVGLYTLVASTHQIIVTRFWDFQSWVLNAVESESIAKTIVGIGVPIGLAVIVAAATNRRKFLMWALAISFTYQIGTTILNIWDTAGKGTPSVPAMFIGMFAATLWVYYRLKPNAMNMEEQIDNSVEGCTIIQDGSKSC